MAHIHVHMTHLGPTSETVDIEGSESHFHWVPVIGEATGAAPLGEAHVHTCCDDLVTGGPIDVNEPVMTAIAASGMISSIEGIMGTSSD